MSPDEERSGWTVPLLWGSLVLLFLAGGVGLVWAAFSHADCVSCAAASKDQALTTYFVGGLAVLLLTAITTVSVPSRVSARRVLASAIGLIVALLIGCAVTLWLGLVS